MSTNGVGMANGDWSHASQYLNHLKAVTENTTFLVSGSISIQSVEASIRNFEKTTITYFDAACLCPMKNRKQDALKLLTANFMPLIYANNNKVNK